MIAFLSLVFHVVVSPVKTKARLEAEIIMLRHQLNVLRQRVPLKPKLTVADRLLFVWLYRLFPSVLNAVTIIQPETIIRWHRTGFRLLCLPNTRSGNIDEEARQGLAARQAGRTAGPADSPANPCSVTDEFGVRCNSWCKLREFDADAPRQRRRCDQGTLFGSNQSTAPHARSARVTVLLSGDLGCPWLQDAWRLHCHRM